MLQIAASDRDQNPGRPPPSEDVLQYDDYESMLRPEFRTPLKPSGEFRDTGLASHFRDTVPGPEGETATQYLKDLPKAGEEFVYDPNAPYIMK